MPGPWRSSRSARLELRTVCTAEPINIARRQLLTESGPLIPMAAEGQATLEAALLDALTFATAIRSQLVVLQTRPAHRTLSLEISGDGVESLLAACLPTVTDHAFIGIPGLRPRPGRDHLDLHALDVDGQVTGMVRLHDVPRRRWREAASQLTCDDHHPPMWQAHPHEFTETERRVLFHRRHTAKPIHLMSAVLRRLPLWRNATWIETSASKGSLWMCWGAEPQATVLADLILHSACRIPETRATVERLPGQARGILLSQRDDAARAPSPANATADADIDEEELRRRRFLVHAAAVCMHSVGLDELRLATPRLSSELGHLAVHHAEAAVRHIRTLATQGPPGIARSAAASELSRLRDLPMRVPTPELAARARQVISELNTVIQNHPVVH